MDKKAQIAAATVAGVLALGGVYYLGTKSAPTPAPAPVASALPPIDAPAQTAKPATIVPAVATTTNVVPNPNPAAGTAPRDTVSLLPAAQVPANNGLAAQTPVLDKTTVSDGQQVSYVGPSGRPSLVTPMSPPTEVETQTTTTKQITGGQTVTTSSHTVHTASTHKNHTYHKHQKSGNVHVARATKHTVMFAAKLPFRLRP